MSDYSSDGYLPGESFLLKEKNDYYNEEKKEDLNDEYNDYYGEYNDKNYFNEMYFINENINNNEYNFDYNNVNKKDYNNNSYYYPEKSYYNKNYYQHKNYNEYNNGYNFYLNKKRKYNPRNNKPYKSIDNYLSSFAIKFKIWLLKTICEEKKNFVFGDKKKINKEIIESLNKQYTYDKIEDKNKKGNITMVIKDIVIEKVISRDINLYFKIIINEDVDIFFINKYIEIKVKGEMFYNDVAKFYFQVKQYKLSLFDSISKNKNDKNSDNNIINYEKNEDDIYNNSLELDLKSNIKEKEEKKYSTENDENNANANIIEPKQNLKLCLNELMESLYRNKK